MEKEKEIIRIAELVAKVLKKEIETDEQEELSSWLVASGKPVDVYKRFEDEKRLEAKIRQRMGIDAKEASDLFLVRLAKYKRRLRIRQITRYAAVLVFSCMVAIFYLMHREMNESRETGAIELAQSKLQKVTLTLANGKQVKLSGKESLALEDGSGISIQVDSSGLAYKTESVKPKDAGEQKVELLYNTLQVPRGGEYFLTLADGTEVCLNAETEIRYPVEFTGKERVVYLTGEAFFSVTKNEEQPFIVVVCNTRVKVLGTEFNVRNYPEEEAIATTLLSGSVEMSLDNQSPVRLQPGEQGVYQKGSGFLAVKSVDTSLYTSWKDGHFVFRDVRVEDIFNTLSRWYDLTVFYETSAVKDIRFTGYLDKTGDFRTLLRILEGNKRIQCTVKDRNVFIRLK